MQDSRTAHTDCAAIRLLRSEFRFMRMLARDWGFPDNSADVVAAAERHRNQAKRK